MNLLRNITHIQERSNANIEIVGSPSVKIHPSFSSIRELTLKKVYVRNVAKCLFTKLTGIRRLMLEPPEGCRKYV